MQSDTLQHQSFVGAVLEINTHRAQILETLENVELTWRLSIWNFVSTLLTSKLYYLVTSYLFQMTQVSTANGEGSWTSLDDFRILLPAVGQSSAVAFFWDNVIEQNHHVFSILHPW